MVYKNETIIRQVLEAKDQAEIQVIIQNCLYNPGDKNEKGRIDKKYTRDILMALRYYKSIETQLEKVENIKAAIQMVKVVHAQATETFW